MPSKHTKCDIVTHIDAPIHFAENKWALDEIPLDTLIGDAVVVDMKAKVANDSDAQLMPSDLEAWERQHGRIPDDSILLLNTGWGKYWPDPKRYLGTDTLNTSLLHFPGMHPDAAKWLVDNRKIKMFGIDTPSLDYGQSVKFQTHVTLFTQNIPGLENVANLDKLPTKGAVVYAAPMFIAGGSGGPCKVFATIKKDGVSGAVDTSMHPYRALYFGLISVVFALIF
ncbi:isatin hydrolase [Nematostella vectensis]|uniref:isatin hydrolase n=1 Tax=Nematostella vectensis TaxID=45351 RepID=UPI0020776EB2|nr:isatin hydrolase [Nematostella vectensis]